jgi:hypothetical protein
MLGFSLSGALEDHPSFLRYPDRHMTVVTMIEWTTR